MMHYRMGTDANDPAVGMEITRDSADQALAGLSVEAAVQYVVERASRLIGELFDQQAKINYANAAQIKFTIDSFNMLLNVFNQNYIGKLSGRTDLTAPLDKLLPALQKVITETEDKLHFAMVAKAAQVATPQEAPNIPPAQSSMPSPLTLAIGALAAYMVLK